MKGYNTVFDHPRKKRTMEVFGKDPTTMDEYFQMCIDVMNATLEKNNENATVLGFAVKLTHSKKVSNSHSAPLLGVRNFSNYGAEKDRPTSYPGWQGRVWIRYSARVSGWSSETLNPTLTYSGTGG